MNPRESLAQPFAAEFAIVNVSRRRFLQYASAGALVLAYGLPPSVLHRRKSTAETRCRTERSTIRVFVAIERRRRVTITCHRAEMGQVCAPAFRWSSPTSSKPTGPRQGGSGVGR
jgi:hypothetical protein